jgi:hypothetical protein
MATVSTPERAPPAPPFYLAPLKRGLRSLGFGVLFGIALAVIHRQDLGITLIYTCLISLIIWFCIDFGRTGVARLVHRNSTAALSDGQRDWPGWPWMVVVIVVSSGVGFSVGTAAGDWITGFRSSNLYNQGSLRDALSLLLFALVPAIALTYFFYSRSVIAHQETNVQAARGQAAESRLKLLESQLEPHMLFNTLANLRVLITLDPARAEAMLDQLIAYLRATLSASRAARHPLRAEFARLADYLALVQVRMADRLELRFELPQDLGSVEVPALLLQPLVENGIKHGLEPAVRGGCLTIGAARDGDELVLRVRDTGVGLGDGMDRGPRSPGASGGGFGLQQVRERLATLYGAQASLRLEAATDADGGTLATIRLPLTGFLPLMAPEQS